MNNVFLARPSKNSASAAKYGSGLLLCFPVLSSFLTAVSRVEAEDVVLTLPQKETSASPAAQASPEVENPAVAELPRLLQIS